MPLYAVILDFKGRKYISQVKAGSERSALKNWTSDLEVRIPELGLEDVLAFTEQLEDDQVVSLPKLVNAWCATASVHGIWH